MFAREIAGASKRTQAPSARRRFYTKNGLSPRSGPQGCNGRDTSRPSLASQCFVTAGVQLQALRRKRAFVMRMLLRLLRRLVVGPGNWRPRSRRTPSGQSLDDYLNMLDDHPGTRVSTTRLAGRRATTDNVLFTREHIETEDDGGGLRQIDVFDTRTCSFGHFLDQNVRATAICGFCHELMCSIDGCAGSCSECGMACCARHR